MNVTRRDSVNFMRLGNDFTKQLGGADRPAGFAHRDHAVTAGLQSDHLGSPPFLARAKHLCPSPYFSAPAVFMPAFFMPLPASSAPFPISLSVFLPARLLTRAVFFDAFLVSFAAAVPALSVE